MQEYYFIRPDVNKTYMEHDCFHYITGWTTNRLIAEKFIEEYDRMLCTMITSCIDLPNSTDVKFMIDIVETNRFEEFADIIKTEYNIILSEMNEIYIMFSDTRPEFYHCSSYDIEDIYLSGGEVDMALSYVVQSCCASCLNVLNMSKYMKLDTMKENMMRLISSYLQTLIIVSNTDVIYDASKEEIEYMKMRGYGKDGTYSMDIFFEGIHAVLDQVILERVLNGVYL